MDHLTERLVEYALALSYEDLPPEVVERTKRLILDTVGCALGAAPWQAPSVARALASVRPYPRPDAPGHRHGRLVAYLPAPQPRRADLPLEGGHLGQRLPQRRVLCPGSPARHDRAGGRLCR